MRRIYSSTLQTGLNPVAPEQARHMRTVLRLQVGESIELFDSTGQSAIGVIRQFDPEMLVEIGQITQNEPVRDITTATAVPKGDRADWMVEKLSEIGIARWIPLKTARSVVHPDGESKFQRWQRIATEASKQSKRPGVMKIESLMELENFIQSIDIKNAYFLSTSPGCMPLIQMPINESLILLIGPEGGWTEDEEKRMRSAGLTPASLGQTILRIETAAVVAAGIVAQG